MEEVITEEVITEAGDITITTTEALAITTTITTMDGLGGGAGGGAGELTATLVTGG